MIKDVLNFIPFTIVPFAKSPALNSLNFVFIYKVISLYFGLFTDNEFDNFIFKDDIETVSYSDDFWYALNNGYIDLDAILVDNDAKAKLIEAIELVESFQQELESSDFFEEM